MFTEIYNNVQIIYIKFLPVSILKEGHLHLLLLDIATYVTPVPVVPGISQIEVGKSLTSGLLPVPPCLEVQRCVTRSKGEPTAQYFS